MSTDETPKKKRHKAHGKSGGKEGGNGLWGWTQLIQNNEAGTKSFHFQKHTVGATITPHDGLYDVRLRIDGPKKHLDKLYENQDADDAMDILGEFNREHRWLIDPEHFSISEPEYLEEKDDHREEQEEVQFEYTPKPKKSKQNQWGPVIPPHCTSDDIDIATCNSIEQSESPEPVQQTVPAQRIGPKKCVEQYPSNSIGPAAAPISTPGVSLSDLPWEFICFLIGCAIAAYRFFSR